MSKFRECEICGAALDPGEKCDCGETHDNGNEKYLPAIRCTQPPVIAENLDSVRENLEILLADISTLPQDDDALKYVKQIRANLSKDFDRMETQRKAVKRQVMEPYEQAEKKYNECIKGPYKAADERLKEWVDTYQDNLKKKCADSLREYFDELCQMNMRFLWSHLISHAFMVKGEYMKTIDANALRDALYEADAITMRGVEILNNFPTVDAGEVPCKIGDRVWAIRSYKGHKHPQDGIVSEMFFTKDMGLQIVVKHIARGEWGKTVFATREEAVAVIEGKRGTDG